MSPIRTVGHRNQFASGPRPRALQERSALHPPRANRRGVTTGLDARVRGPPKPGHGPTVRRQARGKAPGRRQAARGSQAAVLGHKARQPGITGPSPLTRATHVLTGGFPHSRRRRVCCLACRVKGAQHSRTRGCLCLLGSRNSGPAYRRGFPPLTTRWNSCRPYEATTSEVPSGCLMVTAPAPV